MVYKAVLFSYRKQGTTPEAFKKHYETVHMPTLREVTGSLFPMTWTRNYIQRSPEFEDSTRPANVRFGTQDDFDYDAYAEVVFKDKEAFEAFYAFVNAEKTLDKLKAQENQFVDRTKFKMAFVDETSITEVKEGS